MNRNKTLKRLFQDHQGKISDKWSLYLDEWDRLFNPYRDQKINLLEIGVQNGGSLEVWGRYFLKAVKIVGCDIDKKCEHLRYDDPRIAVIVGDANSDDCESKILQQALMFDIILDDGSHKTSDILRSFARYFPHLTDGGIYVVEDLHCSYWDYFEGGLYNPLSAMAFFKRLTDVLNHEHWRNNQTRGSFLTKFGQEFGVKFDEFDLTRIHAIEFVNSLCIIRKLTPDKNVLGERIIVGTGEDITTGSHTVNRTMIQEMTMEIKDDGNLDVFELIAHIQNLNKQMEENKQQVQSLTAQVNLFETSSNALQGRKDAAEQELQSINLKLGEIYSSRAWRIIQVIWRLRAWLLPQGSVREKSLRYIYRPVRYWRTYGFRAFLKRIWYN